MTFGRELSHATLIFWGDFAGRRGRSRVVGDVDLHRVVGDVDYGVGVYKIIEFCNGMCYNAIEKYTGV